MVDVTCIAWSVGLDTVKQCQTNIANLFPTPPKFNIYRPKNDGFSEKLYISFQIWFHFVYPALQFSRTSTPATSRHSQVSGTCAATLPRLGLTSLGVRTRRLLQRLHLTGAEGDVKNEVRNGRERCSLDGKPTGVEGKHVWVTGKLDARNFKVTKWFKKSMSLSAISILFPGRSSNSRSRDNLGAGELWDVVLYVFGTC